MHKIASFTPFIFPLINNANNFRMKWQSLIDDYAIYAQKSKSNVNIHQNLVFFVDF